MIPARLSGSNSGGDKTNRLQAWYREAIPLADRLYDEYLAELRKEGLIP
jgi:hypothetical protein